MTSRSPARTVVLTCAPILVLPLLLASFVRYGGFCISELGFVSDTELIVAAVAWKAHDIKGVPDIPEPPRARHPQDDMDIEAFIRDHPGCCRIVATDLFTGKWVQLVYEQKPYYESFYVALIKMNACGRKVAFMGEPITADQMRQFTRP